MFRERIKKVKSVNGDLCSYQNIKNQKCKTIHWSSAGVKNSIHRSNATVFPLFFYHGTKCENQIFIPWYRAKF
jgi:hypothetical protein